MASRAQGCFKNSFWGRRVGDLDFGSFGAAWSIFGVILDSVGFGRGPQIDNLLNKLETNKKQIGPRSGMEKILLID